MKNLYLTRLLIVISIFSLQTLNLLANLQRTVNVDNAGTLSLLISPEEKNEINELTITGYLNGSDIRYLREMAGIDISNNETKGSLHILNLTNAHISAGGQDYVAGKSTRDNILSENMFANTLLTDISLPNSISSIGWGAFQDCSRLTSVWIENGVTTIESYAFRSCTSLITINIPNSVTSIGEGTFQFCSSLEKIFFPNSIISIGNYAFQSCTSLLSCDIPNSVKTIGHWAFSYCSALKTLNIAESSVYIKGSVFQGCQQLAEIHINHMVPPAFNALFDSFLATLYVPIGSKEAYKSVTGWMNFETILEKDTDNTIYYSLSANYDKRKGEVAFDKVSLKEGMQASFSVIPFKGYEIYRVFLNNEEITTLLKDGSYTIEAIKNNQVIRVEFGELPIYLTVMHAENGKVNIRVPLNSSLEIQAVSNLGWKIHTVMFNNQDVTGKLDVNNCFITAPLNENSFIHIAFESENPSEIVKTGLSDIKVYATKERIIIENIEVGETVNIFNEIGTLLQSHIATQERIAIPLQNNRIYIVRANNKTIKVAL